VLIREQVYNKGVGHFKWVLMLTAENAEIPRRARRFWILKTKNEKRKLVGGVDSGAGVAWGRTE